MHHRSTTSINTGGLIGANLVSERIAPVLELPINMPHSDRPGGAQF